jgi:hypothetical protein
MAAQAAPNRNAKTTICSTSLRAMASMMLAGKYVLQERANVAWACGSAASAAVRWMGTPAPGRTRLTTPSPRNSAKRGDDFEIDDGLGADAAHALEIAAAGDAGHQRGEQQRRDDGADQPQKHVLMGPSC